MLGSARYLSRDAKVCICCILVPYSGDGDLPCFGDSHGLLHNELRLRETAFIVACILRCALSRLAHAAAHIVRDCADAAAGGRVVAVCDADGGFRYERHAAEVVGYADAL